MTQLVWCIHHLKQAEVRTDWLQQVSDVSEHASNLPAISARLCGDFLGVHVPVESCSKQTKPKYECK